MTKQDPTEEELEQGYFVAGVFKQRTQYACLYCHFDALEEWRIRDHVIKIHQAAVIEEARKHQLTVELYDPSGRVIVERDLTDAENSTN